MPHERSKQTVSLRGLALGKLRAEDLGRLPVPTVDLPVRDGARGWRACGHALPPS